MTVWAFVSDIHGNYRALLRAAAVCEKERADRFVCLGDVVGRGDPDACVAWVRAHATLAVVGNRDLDHLDLLALDLRQVVLEWPREAAAGDFILSHGDAKLHRELAAQDEKRGFRRALAHMAKAQARLWFFGHTHRSRVWSVCDGITEPRDASYWRLRPGGSYIVNVGTAGKPLPGRGPAAVTLYDDAAGTIRCLTVG